eukprot:6104268-Amphidinium_carterae.4
MASGFGSRPCDASFASAQTGWAEPEGQCQNGAECDWSGMLVSMLSVELAIFVFAVGRQWRILST